ncbi:MAG: hypothetical protein IK137_04215 [Bacilli bacterium]|nr:hypothetical protein [Bacilli bacterium]
MDEIKKDGQFIKELTEASIDARGRALNRRKINKPFVNSYKKIIIETVATYDYDTEQFKTNWLLNKHELEDLIGTPSKVTAQIGGKENYCTIDIEYKSREDVPSFMKTEIYSELITVMLEEDDIRRLLVPFGKGMKLTISFPADVIVKQQENYNETVKPKVKTKSKQTK